jgi:outer membrane protein
MKKILLISLIFIAFSEVNAQQILTLEQCIDSALNRNRTIRQQDNTLKNKEIAYQQARMDLLPNLTAEAAQNFTLGRSLTADNTYKSVNSSRSYFNISGGLTLFDGLKMKYNIDARKADMKASEADLEKIRSDVRLNVTVAFLQVLLYKENMQTAEAQLALTRQKTDQKAILVREGKVAEGELLELKAQEAKEELSLTQAKNNQKLALLDLAQIIELENFEKLDVVVPAYMIQTEPVLLSAEEVYRSALQTRPEIRGAGYRLLSSQKNVDIAKSAYFPTLDFGAQTGTTYFNLNGIVNDTFSKQMNDNFSTVLGFSLKIPVFNRFNTRNNVASSKLAVENSKLDLENTRLQLQKTIQQAYQNALAAKARFAAAQKSEQASNEAYRYAELKYEAGKASVYELYQAKANLVQVLSELTQSKYEYLLRVKVLELLK